MHSRRTPAPTFPHLCPRCRPPRRCPGARPGRRRTTAGRRNPLPGCRPTPSSMPSTACWVVPVPVRGCAPPARCWRSTATRTGYSRSAWRRSITALRWPVRRRSSPSSTARGAGPTRRSSRSTRFSMSLRPPRCRPCRRCGWAGRPCTMPTASALRSSSGAAGAPRNWPTPRCASASAASWGACMWWARAHRIAPAGPSTRSRSAASPVPTCWNMTGCRQRSRRSTAIWWRWRWS